MAVPGWASKRVQICGDATESRAMDFDLELFVYGELVGWSPAQNTESGLQLEKPNIPLTKKIVVFALVTGSSSLRL